MPAGLRGGGATEFVLRCGDVLVLRRRGRWAQLATLDMYVQEATVLLAEQTSDCRVIAEYAGLAASAFLP